MCPWIEVIISYTTFALVIIDDFELLPYWLQLSHSGFLNCLCTRYTLYRNWSNTHFHFLLYSRFEWEPLKLRKQIIPHFLALDVGLKISQAQHCSSIRDCHSTSLVKNTLFKGEVAWQPLRELKSCSSSILVPPTRAFKWGIVCPSTIITFEDTSSYVKKCAFLLYEINIFWHSYLYFQK